MFNLLFSGDLETSINQFSTNIVLASSATLVFLVVLALYFNKRRPKVKPFLFALIAIVTIGTTLAISGATVYLNVKSDTGGPVHWHADFQFWACGQQLELRDPHGTLSNKIGTPTLHEHNDQRIHLEGVPVTLPEDASFGKFMRVIGGEVSPQIFVVPLNDDAYTVDANNPEPKELKPFIVKDKEGTFGTFISGERCDNKNAQVQVFAYRYNKANDTYQQTKVTNPDHYQMAEESEVPPGDCFIVEFAPPKDRTNHLCEQYGIRDINRCAEFGVKPEERDICKIREVQEETK